MSTLEICLTILSVITSLCAIGFGYDKFIRSRNKDNTEDGKTAGTILTELGVIKGGVEDIKAEQREQRKTNIDFIERLARVEISDLNAHEQIKDLKSIVNKGG